MKYKEWWYKHGSGLRPDIKEDYEEFTNRACKQAYEIGFIAAKYEYQKRAGWYKTWFFVAWFIILKDSIKKDYEAYYYKFWSNNHGFSYVRKSVYSKTWFDGWERLHNGCPIKQKAADPRTWGRL